MTVSRIPRNTFRTGQPEAQFLVAANTPLTHHVLWPTYRRLPYRIYAFWMALPHIARMSSTLLLTMGSMQNHSVSEIDARQAHLKIFV